MDNLENNIEDDFDESDDMKEEKLSKYDQVIEDLFLKKSTKPYKTTNQFREIPFLKTELVKSMESVELPMKNVPDIIYTYRSRRELPKSIKGHWIIEPRGKGKYAFVEINKPPFIDVQAHLAEIEIMNALLEIVEEYTAYDEQGLLSSIRYNRLVDIFTKVTCFHLQSHIRTTIKGKGQIEIDDLYVGIDQDGRKYVLPLEAKSPEERDKLGWVQITNLVTYAKQNFPGLICRPICAKPIDRNCIILIEFKDTSVINDNGVKENRLYKLIRKK
jgi:hypothetical protein